MTAAKRRLGLRVGAQAPEHTVRGVVEALTNLVADHEG